MGRFSGKTCFITGASSGIGAALARALAAEGANLGLAARSQERLDAVAQSIPDHASRVVTAVCDVTRRSEVDAAVSATADRFGGIDVAVANAGFGVSGRFEKLTTEDFRRQFEPNVFGVIETAYAVLPYLEASKGCLGLLGSILGRMGIPASTPYCASKFAVCGLAESLYYDLADKGVAVVCINPGVVDSNIRRTSNDGEVHPDAPDPAPSLLIVPTDKAARDIVNALHRRRFEAVITGHGKIMVTLARHFPRTWRFFMRRMSAGNMDSVEKRKRGDLSP